MMKRKMLSILLALCMVCSLLPVTAMAAPTQQIFWGFKEITSVSQMEIGENYIFFTEAYDTNAVVTGLPAGSAILNYGGTDYTLTENFTISPEDASYYDSFVASYVQAGVREDASIFDAVQNDGRIGYDDYGQYTFYYVRWPFYNLRYSQNDPNWEIEDAFYSFYTFEDYLEWAEANDPDALVSFPSLNDVVDAVNTYLYPLSADLMTKYGKTTWPETLDAYLKDSFLQGDLSGFAPGGGCAQNDRDGYVTVMQAGPGFDTCAYGTIAYINYDGETGWYYGCNWGGVSYVGPFFAYTYNEGEYDAADIYASFKVDPTDDFVGTVDLDDINVEVDVAGVIVPVGAGFVTISENTIDIPNQDKEITLSVGGLTKTLTVDPAPTTYSVTVNNGTGGGSYAADRKVFIKANAPATGMVFDKWTGNVEFEDGTSPSTSFVMPEGNVTVTANYRAEGTDPTPDDNDNTGTDKPTPTPGYYPSYDPTPVIPSVDVDIHDDTLSDAAKAVGSAVKGGKADFTPVAGYTKEDVIQMQKDDALKLVVEKKSSYDPAEKALIDKAAQEKGKAPLVQFLEIDVTLRTMNDVIVAEVDDTVVPLSITVDLNAEMQKAAKEGKTIYVARAHDGKVAFLEGTLNADKTKVTFDSSKFSTYALVALDSQTVTSPQTADAGIFLAVSMSVLSVTGSAVLLKKKED